MESENQNEQSQPPYTVVELTVDSYKMIKAAHVVPSPTGLVLVRGRNAQGKSSLIQSMEAALGVKQAGKKDPNELPIREGAHGAEVILNLGSLVITRSWTRDSAGKAKSKLVVRQDGKKKSGPQGILDELCGFFADPVLFLTMPADEQVKVTLGVLGLADELLDLEAAEMDYFVERKDARRDADRLEKARKEIDLEISLLPEPPACEPMDVLTRSLSDANRNNEEMARLKSVVSDAESRGKHSKDRHEALMREVKILEDEMASQRKRWQDAVGALNDMAIMETAPIEAKIADHDEHSRYAGRRELQASVHQQYDQAKKVFDDAEAALKETRSNIAEVLGRTKFPIPGMAYDHESKSLTIGGIPFSQASQAERLKVAAAVAMSGNPGIKILFAREGSLLDKESQVQLAQIAEENGWQFWLEVVDSDPEGAGVYIEAGEVVDRRDF